MSDTKIIAPAFNIFTVDTNVTREDLKAYAAKNNKYCDPAAAYAAIEAYEKKPGPDNQAAVCREIDKCVYETCVRSHFDIPVGTNFIANAKIADSTGIDLNERTCTVDLQLSAADRKKMNIDLFLRSGIAYDFNMCEATYHKMTIDEIEEYVDRSCGTKNRYMRSSIKIDTNNNAVFTFHVNDYGNYSYYRELETTSKQINVALRSDEREALDKLLMGFTHTNDIFAWDMAEGYLAALAAEKNYSCYDIAINARGYDNGYALVNYPDETHKWNEEEAERIEVDCDDLDRYLDFSKLGNYIRCLCKERANC